MQGGCYQHKRSNLGSNMTVAVRTTWFREPSHPRYSPFAGTVLRRRELRGVQLLADVDAVSGGVGENKAERAVVGFPQSVDDADST